MPELTLVYCYYDNPGMLRVQYSCWSSYPESLKNKTEIVLVDDASPGTAAADVERPEGLPPLSIYRVTEDIPWHQDGARNLGAKMASDGWLFLSDIDHALPGKSLAVLLQNIGWHRKNQDKVFFTFPRLDAPDLRKVKKGPGANILALTKDSYWNRMRGYDEDMCGQYGSDREPRRRLLGHAVNMVLYRAPLIRYSRETVSDANTVAWERRGPDQDRRRAEVLERKKLLGRERQITHLDFEWTRAL